MIIFSIKKLLVIFDHAFINNGYFLIEQVCKVPYLHLISHPTWNSRTSSWTVFMTVPPSIIPQGSSETQSPDGKRNLKTQFRTKVVVKDECISVEAECTPNVVGLLKSSSCNLFAMNKYECGVADLPVIILQQVCVLFS